MYKLIPILLLVAIVIVSGCISVPPTVPPTPPENSCNWDAGPCDAIIGKGYFFNSETGNCEPSPRSGCSGPPFQDLYECQSSCTGKIDPKDKCLPLTQSECESTVGCEPYFEKVCGFAGDCNDLYYSCVPAEVDPATLCDDVKCPEGQACFEGGCVSTTSETIVLNFDGYRESCTDEPKLLVEKNGKRTEVKNYLWDTAPIYLNGEYREYPTMCDYAVCQSVSEYPIDVELVSYEQIGTKEGVPEYTTLPIKQPVTVELNYYKTEDDCNKKINTQKFSQTYNSNDVELSEEKLCQQAGGEWKTFNNGCVDSCRRYEMCTQALTDGCDCGPDKCWGGERCLNNS